MFVLTVANEDGWKLAEIVAKCKAGVVEDEDYAAAKKELGSSQGKLSYQLRVKLPDRITKNMHYHNLRL
jgi:hypothetical protein